MNYFWITFQIVTGIVSPLLLLWILCLACYVIILAIESAVYTLQKLSKKLSKQAPFDDIAIFESYLTNSHELVLYKKGKEIFRKKYSKGVKVKNKSNKGDIVISGNPPRNSGICTDGKTSIVWNDGKETIRKVKGCRSIMKGLRKIYEIQH